MSSIRCERCGKDANFLTTTHGVDGSFDHYRCSDCLWQGQVRTS